MKRLIVSLLVVGLLAGVGQAASILLDFGEPDEIPIGSGTPNATYNPTPSPDPYQGRHWNNVWGSTPTPGTPESFPGLIDDTGAATAVQADVSGFTTDGNAGMNVSAMYVNTATQDEVGCKDLASGGTTGIVTLSGLTEPLYTLKVFGSAHLAPPVWYNADTRRGDYTVGGNTQTLISYGNTNQYVVFYASPVGGVITLSVDGATPGGTETYSYGYLNVLEVIIPEPATLSLLVLGGLAVIRRRR